MKDYTEIKNHSNVRPFLQKRPCPVILVDFCGIKKYMKHNNKKIRDLTDMEKDFFITEIG